MGKIIVKYRNWILGIAILLLVPAIIGFLNTKVNYDMLNYLPKDIETVIGQSEMLGEFHKGAFSMVITEGLDASAEADLETKISEVEHVDTVLGLGTLEKAGLPAEIIPDRLYETFNKGNEQLVAVFFDTSSSADETVTAVKEIRKIVDDHTYVSGMSAFITDLRNLSEQEEIFYIIIAVVLAIIVMTLLLDNWLAPILFMFSIGIMIIINMGTNFVFGEISYITKALSAILQLAVTMDYSIFLWHSYREHLSAENSERAMEKAIKDTASSVIGSSATTVAGFIALCFMSFTLGFDLGLVMAKGVILGVIGSITVLPAVILIFNKKLQKFDHKSILPNFSKISNFLVRFAPIFLVLFIAIIPPFFCAYKKAQENVYYTLSDSLPDTMDFAVANKKLSEEFGMQNVHMILSDANLSQADTVYMTNELKNISGVKSVLNLESVLGDEVPLEILPESIIELTRSEKYEMTLIVSEYKTASDEMTNQIGSINGVIKSYDKNALLVGEASLTQDMINVTSVDFAIVNIVSIMAIFIIILLVTKSISLPFILIAVIESAIFVNLGLSYFLGERLAFIAPICISTIQLGATVDYAILMTSRYTRERSCGKDKKESARIALKTSIPSIIVSGAVLFAATIGVAFYSQADIVSSLTRLMARGAVISIFFVPLFLPTILTIADPLIVRTTIGMKKLTVHSAQKERD